MKKIKNVILAITILIPLSFHAAEILEVVPNLDINKYLGRWYEIARYRNGFQKQCELSWVEYSLRDNGDIKVINNCKKANGKFSSIKGKAWIKDIEEPAKLKVQFFWPFSANYWIIDLGDNYEYAVVSEPKRKYLWILSRTKYLQEDVIQNLMTNLTEKGFDSSRLIFDPWDQE